MKKPFAAKFYPAFIAGMIAVFMFGFSNKAFSEPHLYISGIPQNVPTAALNQTEYTGKLMLDGATDIYLVFFSLMYDSDSIEVLDMDPVAPGVNLKPSTSFDVVEKNLVSLMDQGLSSIEFQGFIIDTPITSGPVEIAQIKFKVKSKNAAFIIPRNMTFRTKENMVGCCNGDEPKAMPLKISSHSCPKYAFRESYSNVFCLLDSSFRWNDNFRFVITLPERFSFMPSQNHTQMSFQRKLESSKPITKEKSCKKQPNPQSCHFFEKTIALMGGTS